jgi:hypothetical protein
MAAKGSGVAVGGAAVGVAVDNIAVGGAVLPWVVLAWSGLSWSVPASFCVCSPVWPVPGASAVGINVGGALSSQETNKIDTKTRIRKGKANRTIALAGASPLWNRFIGKALFGN